MTVRRYLCGLLVSLACICGTGLAAPDPRSAPVLTLPEYIAQLNTIISDCKTIEQHPERVPEILGGIPPNWRIQDGQRSFDIPSEWLRRDLAELKPGTATETQKRINERLELLQTEAIAFQQMPPDYGREHARLKEILAQREFSSIHGPTWYDLLKQRIALFLIGLLRKIFGSSAIPTIGNVLVYVLIGLAVLAAAYWMYRSIGQGTRFETVLPSAMPISRKEWRIWMAEAQAAANQGHWRDAIHLAYWCGISFLEAQGQWQPDSARTPREYLRLLPSSNVQWPTLAALTRSFEVVWYGTQEADAQNFSETLANLERLGCPSI